LLIEDIFKVEDSLLTDPDPSLDFSQPLLKLVHVFNVAQDSILAAGCCIALLSSSYKVE
jgi:hypothetical protein